MTTALRTGSMNRLNVAWIFAMRAVVGGLGLILISRVWADAAPEFPVRGFAAGGCCVVEPTTRQW